MNIDKENIARHFRRSYLTYETHALAQKHINVRLGALLDAYCPTMPTPILEVGCGTGLMTAQLVARYTPLVLWINDLVNTSCTDVATRYFVPFNHCLPGDIETIELPQEFHLIVSASTFQWLARPAETFASLARHLHPEGWLVFSTFGEDNCKEVKKVTGKGLVYHTTEETKALLTPHFDIVHAEEEHYVLSFDTPMEVLRHLKLTGVNAVSVSESWTRSCLSDFTEKYALYFADNGTCPLTYHPQYFVCRLRKT